MATSKKNDDVELDLPAGMSSGEDDVFLDFSDVEDAPGFEPLAAGWYPVVVTGWKEQTVKNVGGKLPAGTKGTQFEFTVMDGHEKARRKVWNTYWHSKAQLPYLKAFLRATGQFTDEHLSSGLTYDQMRDGAVGGELLARLTIQPGNEQYGPQNRVAAVKAYDESLANIAPENADLPG